MFSLPRRNAISDALFRDETALVKNLVAELQPASSQADAIAQRAAALVGAVRSSRRKAGGIDAFLQEYSLSSEEGVVLMCLAEALLRIPDAATQDALIADKFTGTRWQEHYGQSDSLFVNASTFGLMLTGKIVTLGQSPTTGIAGFMKRLVARSGEPVIRKALRQAMRITGTQFVFAQTIGEALKLALPLETSGYRFSYDMLGESAMTAADAERYFASYQKALAAIGVHARSMDRGEDRRGDIFAQPSISVKLSALHPRYEPRARAEVLAELLPKVRDLALSARALGVGLTIDAEEASRLDLSLELFGQLACDEALSGWNGLGLAVQAYSRRARPVLDWLVALARQGGRRIPVRLVKGAYWDSEIKRAQEGGLEAFPVFTRKVSTDLSYLACAHFLLANPQAFYPQFATHNAQTVAAISVYADPKRDFEFQKLHGMGDELYGQMVGKSRRDIACRVYAPVGGHEDLLAYLVRRLLENGANTSFVNRLADDAAPVSAIIADPVMVAAGLHTVPNNAIAAPSELFQPRKNSSGLPLWDGQTRDRLMDEMKTAFFENQPDVRGEGQGPLRTIVSPQDHRQQVGQVRETSPADVSGLMAQAAAVAGEWDRVGAEVRASILERAASLYESARPYLMALLVQEAGKTLDAAQGEVREAVDFLRYYASETRRLMGTPGLLPGPAGERNVEHLCGRGVFVAISPWNFPLAIFTGQIAGALAAGNAVVAKPAEQTPLVAFAAVALLHQAGVPKSVLILAAGDGAALGPALVSDPHLSGVVFTGSNETARLINQALAARPGAILPFIAETGGLNAMIIDSSALPEQAVRDVVASAFDSAGQRCSAARLLFVQEDIAARVLPMLTGAMESLRIGDPADYRTDVGPVIDAEAQAHLLAHKRAMAASAITLFDCPLPAGLDHGTFVSPAAYEISTAALLKREVFGPILHVVRFRAGTLNRVCEAINASGYGLTLGLHTRMESVARQVMDQVQVGNVYVNRNQIGAVVGSQPFGGSGLSGTGPKAGGSHYVARFAHERVRSTDVTAAGGNTALLSLPHDNEQGLPAQSQS